MPVRAIDHILIAMPPGQESQARAFYRDVLGLTEIAKPPQLAARGGCWFAVAGVTLHLGIEAEFAASIKELGKYSIDVAAIGIGSNAIKKTICRAKLIDKPTDIAKVFTEIYYGLSS